MKKTYKYNLSDELWKLYTAEEYCNNQLNESLGIQGCNSTAIDSYCAAAEEDDDRCTDGLQSFWYRCELPEDLQKEASFMDCNFNEEDESMKWTPGA
jgi:hypothetical protein